MTVSALIFGGIGTLVETSTLQLAAFNRAFAERGIDYAWSATDYAASLSTSGGRNRLGAIVLPGDARLSEADVAAMHAAKTLAFDAMLAAETLPLRDGVADLLARAGASGVRLAWATTTSRRNIDAVIGATGGALTRAMFAFVGDDATVARQKPDPEIYSRTLAALGIAADAALAIEDSPTGVVAAKAADIFTVAFPGAMHGASDFAAADAVVTSLAAVPLTP